MILWLVASMAASSCVLTLKLPADAATERHVLGALKALAQVCVHVTQLADHLPPNSVRFPVQLLYFWHNDLNNPSLTFCLLCSCCRDERPYLWRTGFPQQHSVIR